MPKIIPFKPKVKSIPTVRNVDAFHAQQVADYKLESQLFKFVAISLGFVALACGWLALLAYYF